MQPTVVNVSPRGRGITAKARLENILTLCEGDTKCRDFPAHRSAF